MRRHRWWAILSVASFLITSLTSATAYSAGRDVTFEARPQYQDPIEHPVILVHGLGSTMDTWTDKATIYQSLQAAGYDMQLVEPFAYPPGPGQENPAEDIMLIGHRLMGRVEALSQLSVARGGSPRVDIVAHSLGGLATRYLLSRSALDANGTIYRQGQIGKFIDIGTPHSGSSFADAWYGGIGALADAVTDEPIEDWIVREGINQLVAGAIREFGLDLPDPTTPAVRQLDPQSTFIQQLNRPGNSPGDVDYSLLYGDINLRLQWDLFGILVGFKEVVNVGDLVVSRDNASTIPHLGTRQGPNPPNYHVYGYAAPITVGLSPSLSGPSIVIPDLQDVLERGRQVWHGGLLSNPEVNRQILSILEEEVLPPAPIPPSPTEIGPGGSTATVLVLDVSGSMGDPWQGGVKLESAKRAAGDIVTMMEQESQVSGISHGVAIATFSTSAWLNLGLTTDYAQAKGVIAGLVPTNRTNIGAGLQVANDALRGAPADAERIIILLSDGLTNEGLSPPEILSGPVQEAANAGTCIYTVGFGDRGALDEDLLRQIASGSRCGEYYYATDAYQLDNIYIKVRHQALGQIIAEFSGQVEQGRTTPPEEITVPSGKGELNISLVWPGSALDLIVTDPKGRRVDDSYPGASLVPYARFVYLIIKSPLPGLWRLAVFGREVPEGAIDYNAVASVREQTTPVSTDDRSVWVVALTLLLALVVAVFIALTQRQPAGAPAGVARGAGVSVRQGYGPGGLVGFRRGVLGIGRDPRNELVLSDEQASRRHAQIRREPEGLVIYDLNSKNGTYVNGQRVGRCLLRNSDEIRVGDTLLTFHSPV